MIKIIKDGKGLNSIKKIEQPVIQAYKYYPNIIRAAICGSSNCGKTNLLMKILTDPKNAVHYTNIYIYSKSLDQPAYDYLERFLNDINKKIKHANRIGLYKFELSDNVIPVEQALKKSVFIFDDIASHNQKIIEEYFSRGRHRDISCFYLCQTYSRIPKQLIRDNLNLIIIFPQNKTNLEHIYNDHVCADMPFDQFKEVCRLCWSKQYDVLVINLERDSNNGRYTRNFNEILKLKITS